ncbi:hypothetical protein BKA69DRAFT_78105 [Paraphysoderma sedebokerense]|nr:hypothetical protein BKA69DRAFT_78105 [Paraphysoderma sedebokerense]
MNSLYQNILRQQESISADLGRFESGVDTSQVIQGRLNSALTNVQRSIDEYDDLAKREITMAKRDKALGRVAKFRDDLNQMKGQLERIRQREMMKETQQQERQELFQRTKSAQQETAISIDFHLHERQVLNSTEREMDTFIMQAKQGLDNLKEQRTILKRAHRRLLDAANTLGVSRTVIQFIERRTAQDQWIFWGGAAVSIFLMWAFTHYVL